MTREKAKQIAKLAALAYGREHAYVPDYGDDFEPHEWVIEAILSAVQQADWYTATGIET